MKIGILTFHRSINYGAFMQAYALSKEIQNRYGDVVEIIDFEKLSKHNNYAKNLYGIKSYIVFGNEYKRKYEAFQNDLKLLPLSKEPLITDDYQKVLDYINGHYDIVIVGSDAVWAYNKGLGLKNPYWLFGDELNCIKMSYAASAYSLDFAKVPQQDRDYISQCLSSFSYIGVRDDETRKFIESLHPNARINMNCDPTVLLPKPDQSKIDSILYDSYHLNPNKKIVSIMFGGDTRYADEIIKKLDKKTFQVVSLYKRPHWQERFLSSNNKYLCGLSPFEWYQAYSCISLNITTYFHGTLLALKSNVPTISFDNTGTKKGYKSKIKQLMTDLDLSQYWFDNTIKSEVQTQNVIKQVDYLIDNREAVSKQIEMAMAEERKKSVSFFTALDGFMH